jgi:hypothetical protein
MNAFHIILIIFLSLIFIIYFLWYCQLSANVWDYKMTKYKVLSYVPEKYALKTQLYSPEMEINFPVVLLYTDNPTDVAIHISFFICLISHIVLLVREVVLLA